MLTKLPYALQNNILVSIEDVERGLACNCICPGCGSNLMAKKGRINIHHFAHYKEDACIGGIETALHLAAKEIIQKQKRIVLPPLKVKISNSKYTEDYATESEMIKFDKVDLEVMMGDIKPDVILQIGRKSLIVEVAVTHFIDEEKYEKIKAKGIAAIEIDLSDLKDGFSKEDLANMVIFSYRNKKWIHNTKEAFFVDKLTKKYEQDRIEKLAQIERERLAFDARMEAKRKLEEEQKMMRKKEIEVGRAKGFDLISSNKDGESYCPMSIQNQAWKFKNNKIIQQLRKSKIWNGVIYGKGGNERYIYLGGIKIILLPGASSFSLTSDEHKKKKNIFGQLNRISDKSINNDEKCKACKHFGGYMGGDYSSFFCGYRNANRLEIL